MSRPHVANPCNGSATASIFISVQSSSATSRLHGHYSTQRKDRLSGTPRCKQAGKLWQHEVPKVRVASGKASVRCWQLIRSMTEPTSSEVRSCHVYIPCEWRCSRHPNNRRLEILGVTGGGALPTIYRSKFSSPKKRLIILW